ncbi:MAG TPA: hypothetical protein VMZ29_13130 [Candidatus Bathyarchaeia archaeon]|nr:hypothetical protein [Candidatus Bathyarchaeia archaeon]
MYERFKEDKELIKNENYIEISYDEFMQDPLKSVEQIHTKLSLDGFEEYKSDFISYIEQQRTFKPNKYEINNEIIERVNKSCTYAFDLLKYTKIQATSE